MKIKAILDEKGYVSSWCENGDLLGSQEFEVEDTLWEKYWYAFELKDGQLQYSDEQKEKEEAKVNAQNKIAELKKKLQDTDYQAIKFAEGFISAEDYESIKAERQQWRDEINTLERNL